MWLFGKWHSIGELADSMPNQMPRRLLLYKTQWRYASTTTTTSLTEKQSQHTRSHNWQWKTIVCFVYLVLHVAAVLFTFNESNIVTPSWFCRRTAPAAAKKKQISEPTQNYEHEIRCLDTPIHSFVCWHRWRTTCSQMLPQHTVDPGTAYTYELLLFNIE